MERRAGHPLLSPIMPRELTLKGPTPTYRFKVYGLKEAKRLGLIDSFRRPGTHAPVSTAFAQGEGHLLRSWIARIPDALLVATGRYEITVYRPKSELLS